ncbi:MAG: hypothetical protein ACQETI_04130 [Halobacteriota archaeon]
MLLVVTYSQAARTTLRNVCRSHEGSVVRRFGRAALFEETHLGAFLALRLRAKHGGDVQLERTVPFNEFESVPESVRAAAVAYESRPNSNTPYPKFAAGTEHPSAATLRTREL